MAWALWGNEGPLDDQARKEEQAGPLPGYATLLSNRNILAVWVGGFGAFWCYSLMIVWLPVYFANGLKIPKEWLGIAAALPWLANTLIVLLVGVISQSLQARGVSTRVSRVYMALFSVMAGGILICLSVMLESLGAMERLALLVLGVASPTVILAMSPPVIAEHVPASRRAAMIGIGQAFVTLAGIAAPVVTGMLVDTGSSSVQGFERGFLLCGILLMVSAVGGFTIAARAK